MGMVVARIIANVILVIAVALVCALIGFSLLGTQVYTVTTEGSFDPDGDGDLESFKVEERYGQRGYKVTASHEMFDTDDDGKPDSKESLYFEYAEKADLGDTKTSNNYGWAGPAVDGGQPGKEKGYRLAGNMMLIELAAAGMVVLLGTLCNVHPAFGVLSVIFAMLMVLLAIAAPVVYVYFIATSYESDELGYYEIYQEGSKVNYKPVDVGNRFFGEVTSNTADGKDFNYYGDSTPVVIPDKASNLDHFYLPDDPEQRHWTAYYGAQAAAEYQQEESGGPNNGGFTTIYVTKVKYGPSFGWYGQVVGFLLAAAAVMICMMMTGNSSAARKRKKRAKQEAETRAPAKKPETPPKKAEQQAKSEPSPAKPGPAPGAKAEAAPAQAPAQPAAAQADAPAKQEQAPAADQGETAAPTQGEPPVQEGQPPASQQQQAQPSADQPAAEAPPAAAEEQAPPVQEAPAPQETPPPDEPPVEQQPPPPEEPPLKEESPVDEKPPQSEQGTPSQQPDQAAPPPPPSD